MSTMNETKINVTYVTYNEKGKATSKDVMNTIDGLCNEIHHFYTPKNYLKVDCNDGRLHLITCDWDYHIEIETIFSVTIYVFGNGRGAISIYLRNQSHLQFKVDVANYDE